MKFIAQLPLALVACTIFASGTVEAQTVISNEKLVSTTLVVAKQHKEAVCDIPGCTAKTAMFDPVTITCPGGSGQTCTIHIALDAKVSFINEGFYQFLIDDAAPTIGPTGDGGGYTVVRGFSLNLTSRLSMPASVVGTVVNSGLGTHTIAVNIGCDNDQDVCEIDANSTTMRVDIFQP